MSTKFVTDNLTKQKGLSMLDPHLFSLATTLQPLSQYLNPHPHRCRTRVLWTETSFSIWLLPYSWYMHWYIMIYRAYTWWYIVHEYWHFVNERWHIVHACWHIVHECWHNVHACWHGRFNECYRHVRNVVHMNISILCIHVGILCMYVCMVCSINLTQIATP